MRKGFSLFVLMMTLLPLCGCFGRGEDQKALEVALDIRSRYAAAQTISARADLRADYGQRVYDFSFDVAGSGEELTLTLTAPTEVAGITARWQAGSGTMEYDGVMMTTGTMTEEGLSPVTAIPLLLEQVRGGYIASCGLADGVLTLNIARPEAPPGTGTEYLLRLDGDTGALLLGEILVDGFCAIRCEFSDFTFDTITRE